MPLQHVDSSDASQPERMTDAEAKAVIHLWAQEQSETPSPTTADVAEGLDVPIEQAQRLLRQVRRQTVAEPRSQAAAQPQQQSSKARRLGESLGYVALMSCFTFFVGAWTLGTGYTLLPADDDPTGVKCFTGAVDVGLWSFLLYFWNQTIRYIKRR